LSQPRPDLLLALLLGYCLPTTPPKGDIYLQQPQGAINFSQDGLQGWVSPGVQG
jgi:hypothetical protein